MTLDDLARVCGGQVTNCRVAGPVAGSEMVPGVGKVDCEPFLAQFFRQAIGKRVKAVKRWVSGQVPDEMKVP